MTDWRKRLEQDMTTDGLFRTALDAIAEIERQRALLDEKDREIDRLREARDKQITGYAEAR